MRKSAKLKIYKNSVYYCIMLIDLIIIFIAGIIVGFLSSLYDSLIVILVASCIMLPIWIYAYFFIPYKIIIDENGFKIIFHTKKNTKRIFWSDVADIIEEDKNFLNKQCYIVMKNRAEINLGLEFISNKIIKEIKNYWLLMKNERKCI